MRPTREPNKVRCHRTTRLRRRTERAEADARDARAERDALQQSIEAERAALVAALDGPEHRLHGLVALRELLREEARGALYTHATCGSCGGLGRAGLDSLLDARIAALCDAHGLQRPDGAAPPWPRRKHWPHPSWNGVTLIRPRSWTAAEREAFNNTPAAW